MYKKLAAKAELKAEQDKITKLQVFDSSYFPGKSYFEDDHTQNYSVFQLIYRYFKTINGDDYIHHENLKDCLMKVLILPLHLIIVLLLH